MEETTLQEIRQKTTSGVFFLTIRNIGIQAVSVVGFFLLTILLGTSDVGLFAIVSESVSILGYFSDIGLAAALIQQKEAISIKELRTTFTIQQILVIIGLIIVAIIYPQIASSKGYGSKETWILISLCFSFVAASLKTIPSVQLERNLNFKLISTIDIIENLIFYVLAVILAFSGFGVFSYAIATFVRSLVGLITIYIVSPWSIGFSFSSESIKKLFKFGIPFQFNSFIAVAKDRLSNLLVAGIIGRESFGILSWAQKGPRVPLSLMDAVMKVTFPTFSRLQDQPELLKKSLEKSVFYISLFIFPCLAIIASVAPDIINFIPKYSKWLPAVVPLYFYAINYAIAAVTTPLTNAFNAVGKITTTTKLMIMWTVLTWIFYPIFSLKFGYIGTSIATLIVGSSSFIVWILADKIFQTRIFITIFRPLISTFIIILFISFINLLHLTPLLNIICKSFTGILIFILFNFLFSRKEALWFFNQLHAKK